MKHDPAQLIFNTTIAVCIGLYGLLCYLGSSEVLRIYLTLSETH